jgi:hypothetical protein
MDSIIRRRLEEKQGLREDPQRLNVPFLAPCRINVLLVTDFLLDFGPGDFGLEELIANISDGYGPWVAVHVETAHRDGDEPATIPGLFRFDQHDLGQYDQIWLFGSTTRPLMSKSERKAVAEFMNAGGGVFATGDHEDLGWSVCGDLPRVRSMRRWYFTPEFRALSFDEEEIPDMENGRLVAPPFLGPQRHDTVADRGDDALEFDNQSDDVPKTIDPLLYRRALVSRDRRQGAIWAFPHPLLCGPNGVIEILPDHPHEGDCHVPRDLRAVYSLEQEDGFEGYSIEEYPTDNFGRRVAPEVVAWAHNGVGITRLHKGPVPPKRFGAVGAYDGHRVGVGRVTVDSTWHHFLNTNLRGTLDRDGVMGMGFYATPESLALYEEIKAYHRNIVMWIAHRRVHACIAWRAIFWARWNGNVAMQIQPIAGINEFRLGQLELVGQFARDALGKFAGQCQILRWIIDFMPEGVREPIMGAVLPDGPILGPIDPKLNKRLSKTAGLMSSELAERTLNAVAGALVYQTAINFGFDKATAFKSLEKADAIEDAREMMKPAVQRAIELCLAQCDDQISAARSHLGAVRKALG